ncbi:DUF1168-domain-containing protein [Xylariaceae sp. FL0594]|nr:DUF1168-domain-containing protein [Xylariaceae sp. FL0594]
MSGEGPESVPTSADPRSKRPVKKRALTPNSAVAKDLSALFAKPDQPIRIPPPSSSNPHQSSSRFAPPEIVANVQGSSAGAGSGEFHVYKASRRREYERLRRMDEEVARETADADFERRREEKARLDEEKTRRNREKREKKRRAREKVKVNGASGGEIDGGGGGGGGGVVAGPASMAISGVKARIEIRKDDDGDPTPDAVNHPMDEVKGILIEED